MSAVLPTEQAPEKSPPAARHPSKPPRPPPAEAGGSPVARISVCSHYGAEAPTQQRTAQAASRFWPPPPASAWGSWLCKLTFVLTPVRKHHRKTQDPRPPVRKHRRKPHAASRYTVLPALTCGALYPPTPPSPQASTPPSPPPAYAGGSSPKIQDPRALFAFTGQVV